MANQELFKYENSVRKAESAWDRQMKRDGHLKKESRDISEANTATMSATARAFYYEYEAAKAKLDDEATRTNLFGGSPASPEDKPAAAAASKPADKGKKSHLQVVDGKKHPHPDEIITPDDLPRRVVSPEVFDDYAGLLATATLGKPKPSAKVIELDEQHFVVVEAAEHYVVLNRCIHEGRFEGTVIQSLDHRDGEDWEGLVFKSGSGRAPSFVLLNSSQAIACVPGDALSELSATTG